MIIPAHHLLKVIRGATFDFRFQYLVGPSSSVTPVDLTSWVPTWQIVSLDGTTVYANYNFSVDGDSGVAFGGDTNDPTDGIIDLILNSTDTSQQSWTVAQYYLQLAQGSTVIPLLQGTIDASTTLIPDALLLGDDVFPADDLYPD